MESFFFFVFMKEAEPLPDKLNCPFAEKGGDIGAFYSHIALKHMCHSIKRS